MADKKYTTETISEISYPGDTGTLDFSSKQKTGGGVFRPPTIKDQQFPYKTVANELNSSALNTINGQINGNFSFGSFGQLGGINSSTIVAQNSFSSQYKVFSEEPQLFKSHLWSLHFFRTNPNTDIDKFGQSFIPTSSGYLYQISVKVNTYFNAKDYHSTDILKMALYDDNNGTPGNILEVSTTSFQAAELETPSYLSGGISLTYFVDTNFQFLGTTKLLSGQKYYFILYEDNPQREDNGPYYVFLVSYNADLDEIDYDTYPVPYKTSGGFYQQGDAVSYNEQNDEWEIWGETSYDDPPYDIISVQDLYFKIYAI